MKMIEVHRNDYLNDPLVQRMNFRLISESHLAVVSYKWLLNSLMRNELLSELDYWADEIVPKQQDNDPDPDQTTLVESKKSVAFNNSPVTIR